MNTCTISIQPKLPKKLFRAFPMDNVHHLSGDDRQNIIVSHLTYLFDKYGLCDYRNSLMNQEEDCIYLGHGLVLGSLCCSQLFRQIQCSF